MGSEKTWRQIQSERTSSDVGQFPSAGFYLFPLLGGFDVDLGSFLEGLPENVPDQRLPGDLHGHHVPGSFQHGFRGGELAANVVLGQLDGLGGELLRLVTLVAVPQIFSKLLWSQAKLFGQAVYSGGGKRRRSQDTDVWAFRESAVQNWTDLIRHSGRCCTCPCEKPASGQVPSVLPLARPQSPLLHLEGSQSKSATHVGEYGHICSSLMWRSGSVGDVPSSDTSLIFFSLFLLALAAFCILGMSLP